ncbi:MAG: aminotransferase class V-fold PLP-dependent enzyme [Planctomycetota bacterium]|jgi:cysteine desulfurase/selenocysteine lyase|nr:aminotransferase class V-fold PLP-dependent enzyme [Planctomycetota bacterium]MDA1202588.1 aminotransferase class V-fold PLP-dependent enzyme [Planctomycetota bacterium]
MGFTVPSLEISSAGLPTRRYLDHAATSWPKPPEVVAAWQRAAVEIGATAGRGLYAASLEATAIRERARKAAARLLGDVDPERVALPAGCTFALNAAIHGLARPGDHVIATAADHNATLRPLQWLATRGLIELSLVPCDATGRVDPAAIAAAWRPATRLAVISHVSNVTGVPQDVAAIADVVHACDGLLVLDAAQSFGVVPCDVPGWGADVVAAPAHKWLHGMAGVAVLWARSGVEPESLIQGGTGMASDSLEMPEGFSARMEAGSPDVPALAAFEAAAAWLTSRGLVATAAASCSLADALAVRLGEVRGVRVIGGPRVAGIVSFVVEGYDPAEVAVILEQAAGAQVRSGFHCAARIHESLGTQAGGTVRAAFGPDNEMADVEAVVATVATLQMG